MFRTVLSDAKATCYVWLPSTQHVVKVTEELNSYFYLMLIK